MVRVNPPYRQFAMPFRRLRVDTAIQHTGFGPTASPCNSSYHRQLGLLLEAIRHIVDLSQARRRCMSSHSCRP